MTTSSVPRLSFDFLSVRQLQKASGAASITSPYSVDDPLQRRVKEALESNDHKTALIAADEAIDEQIESSTLSASMDDVRLSMDKKPSSSSSSSAIFSDKSGLHQALLLRAEVYARMRNFARAKHDVENAILLLPNYVDAYSKLSAIEAEREQWGKAEVALSLGLHVDSDNADLKSKLDAIRGCDPVLPDVSSRDDNDAPVVSLQNHAARDLEPSRLPPLLEHLMTANVKVLKETWKPEMRNYKHGKMETPLMHCPILGIQKYAPCDENGDLLPEGLVKEEMLDDFKATIDFLFENGVRLDERDKIGFTAVIHAAGSTPQPELLEHLLSRGADPNVRSVRGTVALRYATITQNVKEVDILMRYGADPHVADNDGVSPFSLREQCREIGAIYQRHSRSSEAPSNACVKCPKIGTKRCTKCRVVYYCSRECQQGDWATHKSLCKRYCKGHKRLAIVDPKWIKVPGSASNNKFAAKTRKHDLASASDALMAVGQLFNVYNDEWQRSGNFLLKIQARGAGGGGRRGGGGIGGGGDALEKTGGYIIAYNQKRNFHCRLDSQKLDGEEFLSLVREKGVEGVKGFFWAFMEEGKAELVVITDPIQPSHSW